MTKNRPVRGICGQTKIYKRMRVCEFAKNKIIYVAPQVEVLVVEVEKGFATSGNTDDYVDGGNTII